MHYMQAQPSRPGQLPPKKTEQSKSDASPSQHQSADKVPSSAVPLKPLAEQSSIKTVSDKQQNQYPEQEGIQESEQAREWKSSSRGLPSSNRCVPRRNHCPPSDWGDQQARSHFVKVPDFHRLVNYPSFLTRGRSATSAAVPPEPSGMKHCVMCGKLRLCSGGNNGPTGGRNSSGGKNEEAVHIIPRQNKGVCTGCDVAVWVVLEHPGLEIKWCKGCKNFRPWPCFGEKVLATKCVRCRDRQKEKYAATKHSRRNSDEDGLAAANGLATLLHANEYAT